MRIHGSACDRQHHGSTVIRPENVAPKAGVHATSPYTQFDDSLWAWLLDSDGDRVRARHRRAVRRHRGEEGPGGREGPQEEEKEKEKEGREGNVPRRRRRVLPR